MSQLDEFFKFKIGDFLSLFSPKTGRELDSKTNRIKRDYSYRDWWFVVVSRHLDECPGGIQRYYTCRAATDNGGCAELVRYNEVELIPYIPEEDTK